MPMRTMNSLAPRSGQFQRSLHKTVHNDYFEHFLKFKIVRFGSFSAKLSSFILKMEDFRQPKSNDPLTERSALNHIGITFLVFADANEHKMCIETIIQSNFGGLLTANTSLRTELLTFCEQLNSIDGKCLLATRAVVNEHLRKI